MHYEKDCSMCLHCDIDYFFDEESGEEYPIYNCQKGNDISLDFECKDFEKVVAESWWKINEHGRSN